MSVWLDEDVIFKKLRVPSLKAEIFYHKNSMNKVIKGRSYNHIFNFIKKKYGNQNHHRAARELYEQINCKQKRSSF